MWKRICNAALLAFVPRTVRHQSWIFRIAPYACRHEPQAAGSLPAGVLARFRRADGAIFLGIAGKNDGHEHVAWLTPVAAFAFNTAEAAVEAREGALVLLAKHVGPDGLIASQSVGHVAAAIRAGATALGLGARFIRVRTETPDVAVAEHSNGFGSFLLLVAAALVVVALEHS